MEWVEVTAKTVEEAKEMALDELGVDESEAEFDVLDEPKAGLFGLMRTHARVRARVAPTSARPKQERRERKRGRQGRSQPGGGSGEDRSSGSGSGRDSPKPERAGAAAGSNRRSGGASGASGGSRGGSGASSGSNGDSGGSGGNSEGTGTSGGGGRSGRPGGRSRGGQGSDGGANRSGAGGRTSGGRAQDDGRRGAAPKEGAAMSSDDSERDAGELAGEFVSGLLARFGATHELERRDLDDDIVEIAVEGDDLGVLIGQRGQTLSAVQELARTVVQRRAPGVRTRVLVDIAGYRSARREALERFTREVAEQVLSSGVVRVLEPMAPPDRKVVHDTVNTIEGVSTRSEGEDPRRRVVIVPDGEVDGEGDGADG